MVPAEEYAVAERGVPAVGEMQDVVAVAPLRGPVAAREGASPVPKDQGPSSCSGEQPLRPAHIQDGALGPEDGGDQSAVARHPPGCGGRQPGAVGELRGAAAVDEGPKRDRHHHLSCRPGVPIVGS